MTNHGDLIRITTDTEVFEGIRIARPELLSQTITVLKLENGYNIGIPTKSIKKTETLKVYTPKKHDKPPHKATGKPLVALLSFGGTISSKVDYTTGGVDTSYGAEDFVRFCPEMTALADIHPVEVDHIMSEDMAPTDWSAMASAIIPFLKDDTYAGVVITQGTDTLHYSAAAISYMVQTNKPIIFTAAQRSIDRGSSDAYMNITCAVHSAAQISGGGVAVCMHASSNDDTCMLLRGTKVRKMHTSRRDAFRPINCGPIGTINTQGKLQITEQCFSGTHVHLQEKFEKKTGLLYAHPGLDSAIIDWYATNKYKGLVIAATALGHVAVQRKNSLIQAIKRCISSGMLIVIASQTLYGSTHPYVYTNLRRLSMDAGCIFAKDMLLETAFVKLGWALGNTKNSSQAITLFNTPMADDINTRIQYNHFLN